MVINEVVFRTSLTKDAFNHIILLALMMTNAGVVFVRFKSVPRKMNICFSQKLRSIHFFIQYIFMRGINWGFKDKTEKVVEFFVTIPKFQ